MLRKSFLLIFFLFSINIFSYSQCPFSVNTFPYHEDFESNNGGWVNGGMLDDWAWGIPSKAIIQNAGSGLKCWISGGISGNFYNYNERSYLQTPCFDFTNVPYPHVQFKIYWETENVYDGAVFQYSTNNGATWTNVGAYNEPANCLNENWFNQSNINGLSTLANPKEGWAGTSIPTMGSCNGGGGSLGWVTARHTLQNLAGVPNVQFRFAFGAGSLCNNFNGFAVDDFIIQNSPPLAFVSVAPNNISCNGLNNGSINALATGTGVINYHLDPVNLTNINGTFSSLYAGSYTVTATDANGCSISSSVVLIQPNPIILNSISKNDLHCFQDGSGSISINYSGGVGALQYELYPAGQINGNGQFNGLNSGVYTVVVRDASGCTQTTSVTLTAPPKINVSEPQIINPSCNPNDDGKITILANGGVAPLSYSIGGVFVGNNSFTNLTAGTYTITVKDDVGCSVSKTVILANPNAPKFENVQSTPTTCFNSKDGSIQAMANGNSPIVLYTLKPNNSTNTDGHFTNLQSGIYTIIVIDANSCSNTTIIQVLSPDEIQIITIDKAYGNCGSSLDATISVKAIGGFGGLTYTLLPTNENNNSGIFYHIPTAGTYTVNIVDANQCNTQTAITLTERICCDELLIPNAFSPNGDGKNDEFKFLKTDGVNLKSFIIYDRFGGIAFKSQNINDSWDGKTKGIEAAIGTYYYLIKYVCMGSGKEHTIWGDVTLVR